MSTNQSVLVIEAGRAEPIAGETIGRNLQHVHAIEALIKDAS